MITSHSQIFGDTFLVQLLPLHPFVRGQGRDKRLLSRKAFGIRVRKAKAGWSISKITETQLQIFKQGGLGDGQKRAMEKSLGRPSSISGGLSSD